jgi:hypothetical protein
MNNSIKIKKRENPFAQIDNRVFIDKRLSWKAKGLLGYFLAQEENFIPRFDTVLKQSTDGRDSTKAGIKELAMCGYLTIEKPRDEYGQIISTFYQIYEEPFFTEGYRKVENFYKPFYEDEELLDQNPLFKSKKKTTSFK